MDHIKTAIFISFIFIVIVYGQQFIPQEYKEIVKEKYYISHSDGDIHDSYSYNFSLSSFNNQSFSQIALATHIVNEENESLMKKYNMKINKYKKMQMGGIPLLIGGACFLPTGIILLVSGIQYDDSLMHTDEWMNDNTGDRRMISGLFLIILHIPMTIGGAALTSIGGSKKREYEAKYRYIKQQISLEMDGNSLKLVWHF